ncbi:MAG TPA: penicillin acylase family protein [Bryobacteraceae bacterium]|nr:penicillin acylase family protein [Bryobacteraceae bacterium]
MTSNRAVKYINLSIAVLLGVFLAATYWYAWRPLPQISGNLSAPISANATIARDALGVPHISAANWEDAVFLQGFVTAQDRMWQMDALRRLAGGTLAQVAGPAALDSDREARRLRLSRIAEEQVHHLPLGDLKLFDAYARGVNYFLETHRGRLPLEFTLLNYDPRPWSAADTILVGLQMYRTLSSSWKGEIQKMAMLAKGDATKVNALFPVSGGTEVQPGSNAWVLSGAHTASGRPILANDPHLDFTNPSTWYLVQLKTPDLDVSGASLPGTPCIIIGHNQRIAWGVTNLHYDVQDLYREKFDPATGRYQFRGQIEQARLERELIPVKGSNPVQQDLWVTRHGPIILEDANQYYALRWVAAETQFEFPFLDLNRARNWQEFTAAISRFPGPAQNFVYADVDGNIGYHASGRLPIRKNYKGDVPADGSSGDDEWDGFIPFDQLPAFFDPPSGMIITANQDPFPANYPFRVNGAFASQYRSRQIRDLLGAHNGWRPEDMLVIQKDVYSAFSHFLAQQTVAAYQRKKANNPNLAAAVDVLTHWNGQMEKGTAAPMIVALIYQQFRTAVADRAAPGGGQNYDDQMAPAVIERLLRQRPKDWFPDFDQVLLRCFSQAIAEGAKIQGSNVKRWDYGFYNQLTIPQPVIGRLPLIGSYFNIGPVPMSGSSTTVKQTTRRLGPSMRMVVDFSRWDRSLQNITIGESEQVLSPHYRDQWDAYYAGRSFPMQFQKIEAKSMLRVVSSR